MPTALVLGGQHRQAQCTFALLTMKNCKAALHQASTGSPRVTRVCLVGARLVQELVKRLLVGAAQLLRLHNYLMPQQPLQARSCVSLRRG